MNSHPITPPSHDLVTEWEDKYHGHMPEWVLRHVATEAARWGADQELDACCEWFKNRFPANGDRIAEDLHTARRPKPPSLKQQALEALERMNDACLMTWDNDTIRRALEALPDD